MIHPLHINAWLGIVVELLLLAALIGGLALYQRQHTLSAELSRKCFHIGGGLSTLTFPWIFASTWPVVLLALITIPTLLALKSLRVCQNNLGAVLYRVERASLGEIYFPLSVCLLFVCTATHALLFLIPVLILTLADPAAAVIGGRYGRLRYTLIKGSKSVEGSTAFFLVAFTCVLFPLLSLAHTAPGQAVLIATLVGLLTTLAEAVAWEGLDNLFIPICAGLLLAGLLQSHLPLLLLDLGLTLALALSACWFAAQHRNAVFGKKEGPSW
jgi:phytol kinase